MTEPPAFTPSRPARDTRVDIVRGWLQLTIFASHAAGSWIGAWLIHGAWGLSDSSEQFVFLSGLMLGSVFARKALLRGWRAASFDMLRRALRLYRVNLLVFALFGALAIIAVRSRLWPGEAERLGWGYWMDHPVWGTLAGLTTFYQPAFLDILPVFMWCLLALPAFAALEARLSAWALVVPVAVYAGSQVLGWAPPHLGTDASVGFNPFAWQLLFMVGAWLGRRRLLLGQALPRCRWLTVLSVAILAIGLLLRLSWFGFLPIALPVAEAEQIIGKEGLAAPRVLHALALAWLVAAYVPSDARWMQAAFWRWLAAAGRFSLPVFCLGLFLSWGVTAAFRLWPTVGWLDPVLLVSGSVVLIGFAVWLDRRRAPVGSTGEPAAASLGV